MKRRSISFTSLQSTDPKRKKEYERRIFTKLTAEDYKEHPELYPAVNYERKISFDLLSKDKPTVMINTHSHKNENKLKIISSIESFRSIFFDYNKNGKRNFMNYHSTQKENNIFTNQYSKIQKRNEELNKDTQFVDLKNKYAEKNYEIPKLSIDKNIFKPSILLLSESEINNYIRFNKDAAKNQEKSMIYLDKLNEDIMNNNIAGKNTDILGPLTQKKMKSFSIKKSHHDKQYDKKKVFFSPLQEISNNTKEIQKIKNTFNNIDDIDVFFSPVKNYYKYKNSSSRESSGRYSTRVNSAAYSNFADIHHQNISQHQIKDISHKNRNSMIDPFRRKSIRNVFNLISINKRNSQCNSCKNIFPNQNTELEKIYEDVKKEDTNSNKYTDRIKRYLKTKNYIITKDITPKNLCQHIHNSRDKFFGNHILNNEINLRKSKNKNELTEKEYQLIDENNKMEIELNQCEKELYNIVYDMYK